MTFKVHRVIVKFELELVTEYFQKIENDAEDIPKYLQLLPKPKDLDALNGLLYDFYQALMHVINHSLEFKQAKAKYLKIDTLNFIEKLDALQYELILCTGQKFDAGLEVAH